MQQVGSVVESYTGWINMWRLQLFAFLGELQEPTKLCVQGGPNLVHGRHGIRNYLCGELNVDASSQPVESRENHIKFKGED